MEKNVWPFLVEKMGSPVDHRISEKSIFLLVLSTVHGTLILKQSTVLGAERCSLIAGVPKTACNFQHQEYAVLPR